MPCSYSFQTSSDLPEEPAPIVQPHETEHKPSAPTCPLCKGCGVREEELDKALSKWCKCAFAEAREIMPPGLIEEDYERVMKLRNRLKGAA